MQLYKLDNSFVRSLPGDLNTVNEPRQVLGAVYSNVEPTPVSKPTVIAAAEEVANLIDLEISHLYTKEAAQFLSGNQVPENMKSYAVNYGGHQFGHWAGQLGDGRAITLCEIINKAEQRWEIQLKGAGKTPYSRSGDGRAVLRSSVREFLCSEAMYHLNIPTTRALSIVSSGERIVRDMFYDGNHKEEPGAIVCRVAPSFLRFGNFELPTFRDDFKLTKKLVDYSIKYHFPHLEKTITNREDVYENWFLEVCKKTAFLVSEWMRVGFVHGVLNTDNMSILGLTIDYGPYGWIDNYDRSWTPNTTDAHGLRYRFGNQSSVAHWNLFQLAKAIRSLFKSVEPLQNALDQYEKFFNQNENKVIAAKLGLDKFRKGDRNLMEDLYVLLEDTEIDMTIFFRKLKDLDINIPTLNHFDEAFYNSEKKQKNTIKCKNWLKRYTDRVRTDTLGENARKRLMAAANPNFVLRNYLVQQAIELAEDNDFSGIEELMKVIRKPYEEQPSKNHLFVRRPDWAKSKPGCSMLSCSS